MTQAMKNRKVFRLETLEDRTLLAGIVDPALEGYEAAWGNNELVEVGYLAVNHDNPNTFERIGFKGLEGTETTLVVNTDLLPSTVTQLFFESLANVQVVGERNIGLVHAQDLLSLDIQVDVDLGERDNFSSHLFTIDVPQIELGGETPNFMMLKGEKISVNASGDDFELDGIIAQAEDLSFSTDGNPLDPQVLSSQVLSLLRLATPLDPVETEVLGSETDVPDVGDDPLSDDDLLLILQAIDLLTQTNGLGLGDFETIRLALVEMSSNVSEDFEIAGSDPIVLSGEFLGSNQLEFEAQSEGVIDFYDFSNFSGDVRLVPQDSALSENLDGLAQTFNIEEAFIGPLLPDQGTELLEFLDLDTSKRSLEKPLILESSEPLFDVVSNQLLELVARSQATVTTLKQHVLSKIADEFTPGERVGLIVDTKGPTLKRAFDSHLTI